VAEAAITQRWPRSAREELAAASALALLGFAAWPFAPQVLPLHWGLDGFDNFVSSWIVLLAVPCSCAAVAACITTLARIRERPRTRQFARLLLLFSAADLLLAAAFVAL
jgi:hypothetical protein